MGIINAAIAAADKATEIAATSGSLGVLVLVCAALAAAFVFVWRSKESESKEHRESFREVHRWATDLLVRHESLAQNFVEEIARLRETIRVVSDAASKFSPEAERRLAELSSQLRELLIVFATTSRARRDEE